MDKKYIVKNCPCLYDYGKGDCCNDLKFDQHTLCQDYTDCLIKQVIEKCREELGIRYNDIDQGRNHLANELLQLFKIEEIE